MDYPHIELNLTNGAILVTLVVNDTDRRHLTSVETGHLAGTLATAKNLLPNTSTESEDYADERGFEFNSTTEPTEIDFAHLLDQLNTKLARPNIAGLDAVETGSELYQTLVANWESDLHLAFRRAVHVDILKSVLEYAKRAKTVENFVLVPGDIGDEFVQWMASDLEALGYDLKVKID